MEFTCKAKHRIIREIFYLIHKEKGPQYTISKHQDISHEIIYVDYGKMLLNLNGVNILLKSGDCVFIAGKTPHQFKSITDTPFDFLNIAYSGILPKLYSNSKLTLSSQVRNIFDTLKREAQVKMPFYKEIVACLLTEIIYRIERECKIGEKNQPLAPRNQEKHWAEIVRRALTIIKNEYNRNLSLADLSLTTGISSSHLRLLLKRETRENFSSHLQRTRIEAAKKMLLETPFSITEVSEKVGYKSIPFFFKTFKKITGMTPAEYARSLGDPDK